MRRIHETISMYGFIGAEPLGLAWGSTNVVIKHVIFKPAAASIKKPSGSSDG
jgi:hypothetical protein